MGCGCLRVRSLANGEFDFSLKSGLKLVDIKYVIVYLGGE